MVLFSRHVNCLVNGGERWKRNSSSYKKISAFRTKEDLAAFPTKADLDEFWYSVQCLIKDELTERDHKIGKLEVENAVLKTEI